MNLNSLFSEVIPTMISAWLILVFLIIFGGFNRFWGRSIYRLIKPLIEPEQKRTLEKKKFSLEEYYQSWYESFRTKWLSAPNNIRLAMQSAWRGRERGLAIFAGVFLSSLVITTVLAYAVGLNQGFFQFSLENDVFDAKIDFQEDPTGNWEGRTNDSALWESFCDDLTDRPEFSDCGLVFGRQGIRINGFFDQNFANPQPLNVEAVNGLHLIVGSGEGKTIKDAITQVVNIINNAHGTVSKIEHTDPPPILLETEFRNFIANNSLIKNKLSWNSEIGFNQGILRTAASFIK